MEYLVKYSCPRQLAEIHPGLFSHPTCGKQTHTAAAVCVRRTQRKLWSQSKCGRAFMLWELQACRTFSSRNKSLFLDVFLAQSQGKVVHWSPTPAVVLVSSRRQQRWPEAEVWLTSLSWVSNDVFEQSVETVKNKGIVWWNSFMLWGLKVKCHILCSI